MTLTELWLVRHGESVGNVAATQAERDGLDLVPISVRDPDVQLSQVGEEQAEALGQWLQVRQRDIGVYWVSPYLRARATLAIALGDDGPTRVIVDERLRDRELGILDRLTRHGVARIHPEEAERRRHLGKYYHRPPGGESWADVSLRLRSFLGEIDDGAPRAALVMAHDAIVMLLIGLLLPLDEAELLRFAASRTVLNASVTHLVRGESGWRLAEFSDVTHLRQDGAPVTAHPGSPDVEPE